jgi:hypothetical protein
MLARLICLGCRRRSPRPNGRKSSVICRVPQRRSGGAAGILPGERAGAGTDCGGGAGTGGGIYVCPGLGGLCLAEGDWAELEEVAVTLQVIPRGGGRGRGLSRARAPGAAGVHRGAEGAGSGDRGTSAGVYAAPGPLADVSSRRALRSEAPAGAKRKQDQVQSCRAICAALKPQAPWTPAPGWAEAEQR